MEKIIKRNYRESIETKEAFFKHNTNLIIDAARLVAEAFKNHCKLLICGNGGSAADAQHIAGEFVNRFMIERPPLPAIALTTDTSVITSIGNDYDFSQIFSKQVKAIGKEGDVILAISTSGNSTNIIKALKVARDLDIKSIGLTGKGGGKMAGMLDILLNVDSDCTPRIQEVHITVSHIICELVDHIIFHEVDKD
ncbi:MAG: D-sedoheptulose 7-phosphate isomerase [Deltaproteobacteria bacterium]|nr:D-sedoheptulose 7-phosphate isomerase [Deltaproteobacteria bacterium]